MTEPKISALVLAYNNENEIERCIKSLAFADEVVLLDSFSKDRTVEIAKKLGAKVYQYPFTTFGALRNQALTHASHDWVFSLDTDEVVTPNVINEVKAITKSLKAHDVYYVPRRNSVFGKTIRHGGWYPDYRQPQFFKKEAMTYNDKDNVHEGFNIKGTKGYLKNYIYQYPFDTLQQYLQKMERYSSLMAIRMINEGKIFKTHNLILNPFVAFFKRYFISGGFLDRTRGLLMASLYAYYTFLKYAKLWELHKQGKNRKSD
ncbi:MAG: hypothetical protein S4CHLAM7_12250 [Chlamydiae bacterium]|nr:hypothetical protein [Chlamydiota bacterium]